MMPFSTYPASSHLRRMVLSIGMLSSIHDAGDDSVPCRHVSHLQPVPTRNHRETRLQPDIPGRLVARLTARKDL